MLKFSLATRADALQALGPLTRTLDNLAKQRGVIGAYQSRLSSALNLTSQTRVNVLNAESRIRDVDVADEYSRLLSAQIRQNAATSLLAQANQLPKIVLSLVQS